MLFKEVIGHTDIKQRLIASLKTGRISHAQLFAGNTGYGSLALALAFAQYLLCTGDKTEDACGSCPSCRKMQKYLHPDLHFAFPIAGKSKNPISDEYLQEWRQLLVETPYFNLEKWNAALGTEDHTQTIMRKEESMNILRKLHLKSFESDYKVMIVWLPEKMNAECSNKLLKIIEEPYPKTLFLMVSEQPDQLLQTIQSRLQRIYIPPLTQEEIKQKLIAEQGISTQDAESYAHIAQGNWHHALQLVQTNEEQTYNQNTFIRLMRLCWERKMAPVNEWVAEICGLGREKQKDFLSHALRMIRENFINNFGIDQLNYMTKEEKQFSVSFSPYVHENNIFPLTNEFEQAYNDISRNGNAKIIFTDLCIKVMQNIRPN